MDRGSGVLIGRLRRAGKLGGMTESTARSYLLEARKVLNDNMAPMAPRNLILGTSAETALLNTELFVSAEKRGDSGSALEEARLGRILGVSTFLDQNVSDVTAGTADAVAGTLTDPYSAGTTGSLNSSIAAYEAIVGEFINVDGNDQPTYLAARTASTNTTAVTLNEALKYATLDNAVVTLYKACAVDGNFAAGYAKAITVDGYTTGKAPQVGQLIAFGTGASRRTYTIIEKVAVSTTVSDLLLDRPRLGVKGRQPRLIRLQRRAAGGDRRGAVIRCAVPERWLLELDELGEQLQQCVIAACRLGCLSCHHERA